MTPLSVPLLPGRGKGDDDWTYALALEARDRLHDIYRGERLRRWRAAMALAYGRNGLTLDIDAVVSHSAVLEEARAIAGGHGLRHWLNSGAEAWIPPRPESALRRPTKPGLTVHVAPPEHVLAMKLVALRRKDRPDIRLLIEHLGMAEATPRTTQPATQEFQTDPLVDRVTLTTVA